MTTFTQDIAVQVFLSTYSPLSMWLKLQIFIFWHSSLFYKDKHLFSEESANIETFSKAKLLDLDQT